jgi:hypothetical protein
MTDKQHIALELAKALVIAQPEKLTAGMGPAFNAVATYEQLIKILEQRNPTALG